MSTMMVPQPFRPVNGPNSSTVAVAVQSTAADVVASQLPQLPDVLIGGDVGEVPAQVSLYNAVTVAVAVGFGATAAAAKSAAAAFPTSSSPAGVVMAPGERITVTVVPKTLAGYVAAICSSTTTGNVYATPGSGLNP